MAALAMALVLTACGADTYESLSEDIDQLLEKQIPMSADDKAQITTLLEQAQQLHGDGKSEESVEALKQARQIIEIAEDSELLRKSEG